MLGNIRPVNDQFWVKIIVLSRLSFRAGGILIFQ